MCDFKHQWFVFVGFGIVSLCYFYNETIVYLTDVHWLWFFTDVSDERSQIRENHGRAKVRNHQLRFDRWQRRSRYLAMRRRAACDWEGEISPRSPWLIWFQARLLKGRCIMAMQKGWGHKKQAHISLGISGSVAVFWVFFCIEIRWSSCDVTWLCSLFRLFVVCGLFKSGHNMNGDCWWVYYPNRSSKNVPRIDLSTRPCFLSKDKRLPKPRE